eukprot:TRINITY_DN3020_c0_g1_i1.p1 TRINITY_DN3020_c0_g1~~TRINITY_DN3020_c0_g1_i1.p1  ORF type:complete len:181 (-),score=34.45 TRINITY_DN3020_c0_g1_i1:267-809(-)
MPSQVVLELEYADSGNTGEVTVEVQEDWAPNGAARFLELVNDGYFDGCRIYRVIEGFMAQWGINGDLSKYDQWKDRKIPDDVVRQSNTPGRVSFATSGPNCRTCQIFINFGNNASLDSQGFSPFGEVIEGMEAVNSIYKGYGEGQPRGQGPAQGTIKQQGQAYLDQFPKLTIIKSARVKS